MTVNPDIWLTFIYVLFTKQGGRPFTRKVQVRDQNILTNWAAVLHNRRGRICLRYGK
jgi:hypothetical protein